MIGADGFRHAAVKMNDTFLTGSAKSLPTANYLADY